MHGWNDNESAGSGGRSSFIIVYAARAVVARLFRKPNVETQASWREVATDMLARFFVGLAVGGGVCVLLVPIIFWPSRQNPHSFFEQISHKEWVGWLFAVVLVVPAIIAALTTRLRLPAAGFHASESNYDVDDRVKIGCMGMMLPLALATYGIHRILNPRKLNRFTGQLMERDDVMSLGICAIGMALLVHGWGFVPYTRIPLLKYLVMVIGVGVFVYGLNWANRGH